MLFLLSSLGVLLPGVLLSLVTSGGGAVLSEAEGAWSGGASWGSGEGSVGATSSGGKGERLRGQV